MSKLSSKAESVLDAGRQEWRASADATARMKAGALAKIAQSAPESGLTKHLQRPLARLGIALVAGGLVAGVVAMRWQGTASRAPTNLAASSYPSSPPPTTLGSAAAPLESPTIAVSDLPEAIPERSTRPAPSVHAVAPSARSTDDLDGLAEETRLVRSAQVALRAHDTAEAGHRIDEHARRFPHGVLREERMTLRVLVLCENGDVVQAKRLRAELDRSFPGSSHAARLEASCAGSTEEKESP